MTEYEEAVLEQLGNIADLLNDNIVAVGTNTSTVIGGIQTISYLSGVIIALLLIVLFSQAWRSNT